MSRRCWLAAAVMLALPAQVLWADDLTGADRFLCAAVQVTVCSEDGDCVIDLPWNQNIPDFIEVDLGARRLATTEASGENRSTEIEHFKKAFSVCLEAKKYMVKF